MTTRCSHPRDETDAEAPACRVCATVRGILHRHERLLSREREKRLTIGERVMRGTA